MNKIAICVFGVNGVGKSTLLGALSGMCPNVIVVRGSTILKEALNVASYEALELMSADIKKQTIIDGMAFLVKNTTSLITIVDAHLVISIRKSDKLVIEDMWDDRMLHIFQGFVYINARPSAVVERRQMDNGRFLRVMSASPQMCTEDLQVNSLRWDELSVKMPNKKVVMNDQSVEFGAMKIFQFIKGLM